MTSDGAGLRQGRRIDVAPQSFRRLGQGAERRRQPANTEHGKAEHDDQRDEISAVVAVDQAGTVSTSGAAILTQVRSAELQ